MGSQKNKHGTQLTLGSRATLQRSSQISSIANSKNNHGTIRSTNASQQRLRCICFTAYKDPRDTWDAKYFTYVVMQNEECPKTKRKHWQGYMELNGEYSFNTIKKKIFNDNTIHIEPRRGSAAEAITYCKKLETRIEGTEPYEHGEQKTQGKRSDIEEYTGHLLQSVAEGKMTWTEESLEKYGHMLVKYPFGTKSLLEAQQQAQAVDILRDVKVEVLWGDTGVGKTTYVFKTFKPSQVYQVPFASKVWFNGYTGQPVLFFDEFCGLQSGMPIGYFLRLLDKYPLQTEYKGGFVPMRHTHVIICSNLHPSKWYPDIPDAQYQALMRRLTSGGPIQHWINDEPPDPIPAITEVKVKRTKAMITTDYHKMVDNFTVSRNEHSSQYMEEPVLLKVTSETEADLPGGVPTRGPPPRLLVDSDAHSDTDWFDEPKRPRTPRKLHVYASDSSDESAIPYTQLDPLATAKKKTSQKLPMGNTRAIGNFTLEPDCQNQLGFYTMSDPSDSVEL
jgi:hypothetical protein